MGRKRKAQPEFEAPATGEWVDMPAGEGEWVDLPAVDDAAIPAPAFLQYEPPPPAAPAPPRENIVTRGVRGFLDRVPAIRDAVTASQVAEPFARGAAQGVTLGHGENMTGAMGAALEEIAPIRGVSERDANSADRYRRLSAQMRADNAAAEQANPVAYGTGQVGGAMVTGAPLMAAAGGGALGAVTASAVEGAIAGPGYSNADNAADATWDALAGAELGAITGGVGPALQRPLASASRGATRASRRLDDASETARARSVGPIPASAIKSDGGAPGLGRAYSGVGVGNRVTNAPGMLADARRAVAKRGPIVGNVAAELTAAGVSVPRRALAERIRGIAEDAYQTEASEALRSKLLKMADAIERAPTPTASSARSVRRVDAENLIPESDTVIRDALGTPIGTSRAAPRFESGREYRLQGSDPQTDALMLPAPPTMSFGDMWQLRRELDSGINFGSEAQNEVLRQRIRGAIDDTMRESAQAASPDIAERWTKANADYAAAETALTAAQQQAKREVNYVPISIRDALFFAGGAGASDPIQSLVRDGAQSITGGGGSMLAGGAALLASRAIRGREHALISRGAAGGASSLRKLAAGLRGVGETAQMSTPLSVAVGTTSDRGREWLGATEPPATRIRQRFERDPQSFGRYAPQIQEALQSDDGVELGALHFRLMATDPQYRQTYERSEQ